MAAPTEIAGEFATDDRKYHLVDDKAKKEHQSWEQAYRSIRHKRARKRCRTELLMWEAKMDMANRFRSPRGLYPG